MLDLLEGLDPKQLLNLDPHTIAAMMPQNKEKDRKEFTANFERFMVQNGIGEEGQAVIYENGEVFLFNNVGEKQPVTDNTKTLFELIAPMFSSTVDTERATAESIAAITTQAINEQIKAQGGLGLFFAYGSGFLLDTAEEIKEIDITLIFDKSVIIPLILEGMKKSLSDKAQDQQERKPQSTEIDFKKVSDNFNKVIEEHQSELNTERVEKEPENLQELVDKEQETEPTDTQNTEETPPSN